MMCVPFSPPRFYLTEKQQDDTCHGDQLGFPICLSECNADPAVELHREQRQLSPLVLLHAEGVRRPPPYSKSYALT
jgi:hypothetical protein